MSREPNGISLQLGQKIYQVLGLRRDLSHGTQSHQEILGRDEGNKKLGQVASGGRACMVSRLGTSEACVLLNHLEVLETSASPRWRRLHQRLQGKRDQWDFSLIRKLENNAGVFPPNETIAEAFSERLLSDLSIMDFAGVWRMVPGEEFLLNRYCQDVVRFEASALEPYYFAEPWSAHLAGKRVLVVHPFAETIESQYTRNRDRIFPGSRVLPDFELSTVRAVQSLAGNRPDFADWLEALAWMKREIAEKDFDVALIGAGGYGLALAAHVKRLGKIAIHMGGSLQILFGIKGRRWDNMPAISKFYNEHWVRPSASEQIPSADRIEGGCYW